MDERQRSIGASGVRVEVPRPAGAADEASLQRALDEVRDTGGGHVVVGPGRWELVAAPLRIHAGTRLTLTPGTRLVRTGALRTMLINGPYGSGREIGGHDGPGGVIVEGGIWDVNGFDNPLPSFGMVFNHARDVVIRDLEILAMPEWHAIETNSTYNVTVAGCRFVTGIPRQPNAWQTEAVSLDLSAPELTAWGAEDSTHAHHVRIIDNYCAGYPTFTGCHTGHPTDQHTDVVIANNTATDLSDWAVSLLNTSRVSITGNVFSATANGIRIRTSGVRPSRPVRGITIMGNVIDCTAGPAVVLEGHPGAEIEAAVVTGNALLGPAAEPIVRAHAPGAVVANNGGAP